MSTSDGGIYWAEDVLGEPFPAQDHTFIKRGARRGVAVSGLGFVATVSIGVAIASAFPPSRLPIVPIVTIGLSYFSPLPPVVVPAPEPSAPVQGTAPSVPPPSAPVPRQDARESARNKSDSAALNLTAAPTPQAGRPPKSGATAIPQSAAAGATHPVSAARSDRQQLAAKAREKLTASHEPGGRTPSAQPTPELRAAGISSGAAAKPQDIAPAEKLGIKEVYVEGIELLNGKRIRTGTALPNGEILVGTDPERGMVETDRRVMTLIR